MKRFDEFRSKISPGAIALIVLSIFIGIMFILLIFLGNMLIRSNDDSPPDNSHADYYAADCEICGESFAVKWEKREEHHICSDCKSFTHVTEPFNGEVFEGSYNSGMYKITVTASSSSSCVVKLKTISGQTKLSFYVRAGETVTRGVPNEYLYVYFASGKTWYGEEHLFGKNTTYSMDDEIVDFGSYSISYKLYPVTNGNFEQTPIDEDEFK